MDKEFFIENYKALKQLKEGKKPLRNEFLKFCKADERHLVKVFGKDAYSKLQEVCGDKANKLQLERTPLFQILDQYGQLARE